MLCRPPGQVFSIWKPFGRQVLGKQFRSQPSLWVNLPFPQRFEAFRWRVFGWAYVEPMLNLNCALNCASTGCTSRLTLLRAGHVDSTSKAEPLQEIWACGGGSIVKFETAGDSECFSTKLQDVVVTTMFHSSESISKSDLPNTISFMMRTSDCLWLLVQRHLQVPHHFQQTHALAISLLCEGAHWCRGECQDYGVDLVLSCTAEIYWFALHVSNSINIIK